jgi:WD40 repeat protein
MEKMQGRKKAPRTCLADLPPELWDHITTYLPTASSIANLSRTSKPLHAFVEKDAWKSFAKIRFPSTAPHDAPSFKHATRTLTTLSRAWDKRAFLAQYIEPQDDITIFPGRRKTAKWAAPRGQTIGFTPQLAVTEEIGPRWQDRNETLAFSAGAQICIRHKILSPAGDSVRWTTYRPLSAAEGRDDVTALHLLHPDGGDERLQVVTGTANGDLQLVGLPIDDPYDQDVRITYFTTQGMGIRSSTLLQENGQSGFLAANLGDSRIALYRIDSDEAKIAPSSQFDLKPVLRPDGNPSSSHRAWSTNFLSPSMLAVGAGPSDEPIHLYPITESGLSRDGVRKISLQNDLDRLDILSSFPKKSTSSVYTVVPLPTGTASSGNGSLFLSGAYDGIVRLHDSRSNRDVEATYSDPTDNSAIYSILPRGQERIMVGTSRHNLLKVFDLRLGAKCYNYSEANPATPTPTDVVPADYNIFLQSKNPHSNFPSRRTNHPTWARPRSIQSSVYSLASPSAHSPFVYAGVENAIMSLAFTHLLDPYPDPVFFEPWTPTGTGTGTSRTVSNDQVLGLAMFDQGPRMRLSVQRGLGETRGEEASWNGLDERWEVSERSSGV